MNRNDAITGNSGVISCTTEMNLSSRVVISGGTVNVYPAYTPEELVKHCRWCIRELPCTDAEITVHWFMYGKHWDKASKHYRQDVLYLEWWK